MAIRLVAIILVLAVCRGLPDLVRLRDFTWFHAWVEKLKEQSAAVVLLVGVGVPALFVALIEAGLDRVLLGLFGLILGAFVLYYCWGPRDLERDVEAVVKAPDADRRAAALHALRDSDDVTFTPESLVETVFAAALSRWFGVLFWFVVLGPAGALLYRLSQFLALSPEFAHEQSSSTQIAAQRLTSVLDWAPAHLMALCLALASNFDAVFKTWNEYHRSLGKGYFTLDLGFLAAIARASVDADVAAEDHYGTEARAPTVVIEDAMVLVRRVLVVWLTLVALIVIGRLFA
ncbi:MAG TPA: cobalamin biosynthesis protein [Rudaea sp.]|jgi:AmpE protein|nr:cobalamin biosynthesis protein [Rudaea sp.]